MIKVSLIVAYASNYIIGKDGKLPWHISNDLKYFKKLTDGNPIIMGRKTFESIGKPLPNRYNIIITRNQDYEKDNCMIYSSINEAIDGARNYAESNNCKDIFIIGGSEIFMQSMNFIEKAYITEVHKVFDGDAFFEPLNKDWQEISRQYHDNEIEGIPYSFVVFEKIKSQL